VTCDKVHPLLIVHAIEPSSRSMSHVRGQTATMKFMARTAATRVAPTHMKRRHLGVLLRVIAMGMSHADGMIGPRSASLEQFSLLCGQSFVVGVGP
jgi:hypothetical protein